MPPAPFCTESPTVTTPPDGTLQLVTLNCPDNPDWISVITIQALDEPNVVICVLSADHQFVVSNDGLNELTLTYIAATVLNDVVL